MAIYCLYRMLTIFWFIIMRYRYTSPAFGLTGGNVVVLSGSGVFSKVETASEVFEAAVRMQSTSFIFKLYLTCGAQLVYKPVKLDKEMTQNCPRDYHSVLCFIPLKFREIIPLRSVKYTQLHLWQMHVDDEVQDGLQQA